ncbi:MAG TPA: hypothetical protein VID75_07190 [Acidimicrobiales bacterium]
MPLRIRRRHLLHSAVSVAVLVQLGFAAAFLVDAAVTNATYDAPAARHVSLNGRVQGCAPYGAPRRTIARMCTVDYHYNGATFTTLIALGRSTTVFVDPRDTSKRMTEVDFDGRLEETTVDLVLASVLLVGATTTTTIHLLHIRRRRAST